MMRFYLLPTSVAVQSRRRLLRSETPARQRASRRLFGKAIVTRYTAPAQAVVRAGAAFAKPEIYEALENRDRLDKTRWQEGNRLPEGGWDTEVSEKSLAMTLLRPLFVPGGGRSGPFPAIGAARYGKHSRCRHTRGGWVYNSSVRKANTEIALRTPELRPSCQDERGASPLFPGKLWSARHRIPEVPSGPAWRAPSPHIVPLFAYCQVWPLRCPGDYCQPRDQCMRPLTAVELLRSILSSRNVLVRCRSIGLERDSGSWDVARARETGIV